MYGDCEILPGKLKGVKNVRLLLQSIFIYDRRYAGVQISCI